MLFKILDSPVSLSATFPSPYSRWQVILIIHDCAFHLGNLGADIGMIFPVMRLLQQPHHDKAIKVLTILSRLF
jgi:hypothetical protein